jgi:hypothetical protein
MKHVTGRREREEVVVAQSDSHAALKCSQGSCRRRRAWRIAYAALCLIGMGVGGLDGSASEVERREMM